MIVLDTHTLLWWLGGGTLGKQASAAIRKESGEDGEIVVSAISAWEIALLVRRGKIGLSMDVSDWVERSVRSTPCGLCPSTTASPSSRLICLGNFIMILRTALSWRQRAHCPRRW